VKVLVIGGTQFIGRHVVEKLLAANHEVTLFNRGKTGPTVFPDVPLILADRTSNELPNLKPLRQNWDAVIDLCAYYPLDVSRLLSILNGHTGRYTLCSSVSAYEASKMLGPTPVMDESSPLRECSPEEATDTTMATYGERKAECERVAMRQSADGVPSIVIRPGLVYGAHDHTDRFAYWIWRTAQEKPFILPDDGLSITARTYVPDLASAFVACLNSNLALGKAYNIAETHPLNFRDTLGQIGTHLKKDPLALAVSVPSEKLLELGVEPWSDLPLWLPNMSMLIDTTRAQRDLAYKSTPTAHALATATESFLSEKRAPRAGLSSEAEARLLARMENT
jgi:2'-hydroxyisoflavone reductase